MFNWFKKAPKTHYQRLDDVVWASTAARQRGIEQRLHDLRAQGVPVVLVTYSLSDQGSWRAVAADSGTVTLMDAATVSAASLMPLAARGRPPKLMVCGLGPVAEADAQMLQRIDHPKLSGLEVEFHSSLDDPALRPFVSGRMREMLQQLGLEEDEPIQHRWVTNAIANARSAPR
jgi:hypothetical protein